MTQHEQLRQLLAREEAILRLAFLRAMRQARARVRSIRLADVLDTVEAAVQDFTAELPKLYARVGNEEMRHIKQQSGMEKAFNPIVNPNEIIRKADDDLVAGIDLSFNPEDDEAAVVIERARHNFLTDFSAKQRKALRAALAQAQREGLGTDATARLIRDSIGLTETQWDAVNNYRGLLVNGNKAALDRKLRDRRFDSTVQTAIDNNDILDDSQIDRMVDRYTARMLDYRANNIARTESHRAMSAARNLAWQQMTDQLGVDDSRVIRTWNTTIDGRERDTHHEMDGQEVSGFEPFISPSGARLRYPGDPDAPASEVIACRCLETYGFAV